MKLKFKPYSLLVTISLMMCSDKKEVPSEEYLADIERWKEERLEEVMEEWVPLEGLFWLKEGDNTMGSDSSNAIVFPDISAPEKMVNFFLQGERVRMRVISSEIFSEEKEGVTELTLSTDTAKTYQKIQWKNFEWNLITRDYKTALRLKRTTELADSFKLKLPYYPIDMSFHLEGEFIPYEKDKTIPIGNVLGMLIETKCPGKVVFEIDNKSFSLDVLEGKEDSYFLIFADATRGKETYGGGRYMYIPKEDNEGKIILDFNKAYNPPCAFTSFATCPLPPIQNILDVEIPVGEKYDEDNFGH
ncbi:MAG: DUF1684 domain-containing protein [Cyclobacteriaceae bacterium]|nr:DUF1684 domain-containing protein [Cyclobacteriaceae bacterium]